jgi:hypothetical protein
MVKPVSASSLDSMSQEALKKSTFAELHKNTFTLLIVFISVSTAMLIWLGNVQTRTSFL